MKRRSGPTLSLEIMRVLSEIVFEPDRPLSSFSPFSGAGNVALNKTRMKELLGLLSSPGIGRYGWDMQYAWERSEMHAKFSRKICRFAFVWET
jgi:hypothetical protein